MNDKEKNFNLQDLYKTLDRIAFWTNNCDTKASIILGAFGVFLSILFSNGITANCKTVYIFMSENNNFLSVGYFILVLISIVSMLLGCLFLISVLVPRIKNKKYESRGARKKSLLFFNSIANHKQLNEFKRDLENNEYDIKDDLISQIYITSIICKKKFSSYKKGIVLTLMGFVVFLILYIIGYLIATNCIA